MECTCGSSKTRKTATRSVQELFFYLFTSLRLKFKYQEYAERIGARLQRILKITWFLCYLFEVDNAFILISELKLFELSLLSFSMFELVALTCAIYCGHFHNLYQTKAYAFIAVVYGAKSALQQLADLFKT